MLNNMIWIAGNVNVNTCFDLWRHTYNGSLNFDTDKNVHKV